MIYERCFSQQADTSVWNAVFHQSVLSHFSATPPSLPRISSFLPCAGLPHPLLTQAHYVCVSVSGCEGEYEWGGERHKWALSAVRVMMQEQPKLQQKPHSPEISGCDSALSLFPHTHFLPHTPTHIQSHGCMHTLAWRTHSQAALSWVNKSEMASKHQLPNGATHTHTH